MNTHVCSANHYQRQRECLSFYYWFCRKEFREENEREKEIIDIRKMSYYKINALNSLSSRKCCLENHRRHRRLLLLRCY